MLRQWMVRLSHKKEEKKFFPVFRASYTTTNNYFCGVASMTVQFWQGWPIKRFLKIRNRVKNRVILKLMAIKPPVECFRVTIKDFIVYILSTYYTMQIEVFPNKTPRLIRPLCWVKWISFSERKTCAYPERTKQMEQ